MYPQLQKDEWLACFEMALRSKGRDFNQSESIAIGEKLWPSSFLLRPQDAAIHYLVASKSSASMLPPPKSMACDAWASDFLDLMKGAGIYLRRRDDVLLAKSAWEVVGHKTPAQAVDEHLSRLSFGSPPARPKFG